MNSSVVKNSWWLSDAQAIADANPYTFYKPSPQSIALLQPGDGAKLIFRFDSDDPEAPSAERMWVEIDDVSHGQFRGRLDNEPAYIKGLECGESVSFEPKHIIQISIDDPVPDPTAKYASRCFVTRKVLYEGAAVGYLYREEPDNDEDSGWRIMAGDESQEYMDETDNISWVSLGAVLREDDSFLDLLEAPVGSFFELDRAAGRFVEVGE